MKLIVALNKIRFELVSMFQTSHRAVKVFRSLRTMCLMSLLPSLAYSMNGAEIGDGAGIGKHAVQFYREDPRPSGDVPMGVRPESGSYSTQYPRRRLSRRAQRRLNRRSTWIVVPEDIPPFSGLPIEHRNLSYGSGEQHQQFDLYLPGGCREGRIPLVIWLPGDDWSSSPRIDCPLTWLTQHGFAVASISYRPSQTHIFPTQRDDCLAAINRLSEDAAIWSIDPTRICLIGQAAGAHLSMLIGLDPNLQEKEFIGENDFSKHRIAAICGISTIAHLPPLGTDSDRASSAASRLIGGPLPEFREAALRASPISYASRNDPPTLLIHCKSDETIPVSQSERLHAALLSADVDSTLILPEGQQESLVEDGIVGQTVLNFLIRTLDTDLDSIIVTGKTTQIDLENKPNQS